MSNQYKKFELLYSQALEPELIPLEEKRKWIRIPALLLRVIFIAFFYGVISGLAVAFSSLGDKAGDDMFLHVLQGFFCFIFCAVFLILTNYLVKYLRKLYPNRIEGKAQRIIAVLLLSAILALPVFGIVYLIKQHPEVFTFWFGFKAIFCVLIIGIPLAILLFRVEKKFCRDFKQHIIAQLVPYVFPESTYEVTNFISKEMGIISGLFGTTAMSYYRYQFTGSDLVNAKIGNSEFEFSQLDITETSTSAGSNSSSRTTTIFDGLFCRIKGSALYPAEIIIHPNTGSERFAGKLRKLFHVGGNLLKTGDEEFDAHFLCYAANEQSTLSFLSLERRKTMLQVLDQWEAPLSISFVGNTAFVAISITEDIFKPTIFHSLLNYENTEKYYLHLQKIAGLVSLA